MAVVPTTFRPYRYSSSPIIPLVPATWYAVYVGDFTVMVDPTDSTKLMMFISGIDVRNSAAASIGLFRANVSDPYTWTDQGIVLTFGSAWENGGIRLGSVLYDSGTYYMYYTGIGSGTSASIGLATSTDGITWTKHASNPILTPTGQSRNDGTHVSEPSVIKEGSTWTMLYAYRDTGVVLPGFRAATSSDGVSWTKVGSGDVLTTAPLYAEFHQLVKVGNTYNLVYESGSTTSSYKLYLATSDSATGPYTPVPTNPIFEGSRVASTFDRYHTATPGIAFINGNWHVFYQGGGETDIPNYVDNNWAGGVAIFPNRDVAASGGAKGR